MTYITDVGKNPNNNNIILGENSAPNIEGINNVQVGVNTSLYNFTSNNNISLGFECSLNSSAENSINIGYQNGYSNQKKENIAVGYQSGYLSQEKKRNQF